MKDKTLFQVIEDTLKEHSDSRLIDLADFITLRDALCRAVEEWQNNNK